MADGNPFTFIKFPVWYADVDSSTLEQGALVPCDDVTCQGQISVQGQEVSKACDMTGTTCVCSRGFVIKGEICVGTYIVLFSLEYWLQEMS